MSELLHPAREWLPGRVCAIACAALLALVPGCDYDDPDDPGDPGDKVDFIRFSGPGRFSEVFLDTVFQSGEFAIDVMGAQPSRVWHLGPGTQRLPGIDDDLAPYPNPANSRKQTPHDGRWDKRYWVQFAGGAWQTLNISVDDNAAKFRASSSPPSFVPATIYMWCPELRACMSWARAVARREVRCYKHTLNGYERPVGADTCIYYHPRMHWRITTCDDCPIEAVTGVTRDEL